MYYVYCWEYNTIQQKCVVFRVALFFRFRNTFDSEERLIELCQRRVKATNKTLSLQHGDFHFNNLMFKIQENGNIKIKVSFMSHIFPFMSALFKPAEIALKVYICIKVKVYILYAK